MRFNIGFRSAAATQNASMNSNSGLPACYQRAVSTIEQYGINTMAEAASSSYLRSEPDLNDSMKKAVSDLRDIEVRMRANNPEQIEFDLQDLEREFIGQEAGIINKWYERAQLLGGGRGVGAAMYGTAFKLLHLF